MSKRAHSDGVVTIGNAGGAKALVKSSMDVALDALGGKWKLLIVALLAGSPRRTSELRRLIPGINQRMLIAQLRELQTDGLVERRSYHEVPPRVVYRLSRYGKTVLSLVTSLSRWGAKHVKRIHPKNGVEYRVVRMRC